jgi:hypothetical protein
MWDQAVSGYETMSGLWFRYILSFEDFTPRSQFKSVWKNASASVREWTRDRRELSRWSAVLGLAALLIWLGGAKLRNKRKNQLILGRRLALLIKERTRLERWISRLPSKVQLEIQKSPLHSKWWQTYEDARFGPNEDQSLEPAQKMLNALRAGLLLSRNKMH